ncbi:MAG: hypothetical protein MJ239_02235 [Bacilli bacterium]|nr:hypothetical protein [Bacilli bacterium]
MKKKSLAIISLLPFLAGCGGAGGIIDPIPYSDPGPETKTDLVFLGFSDSKQYSPSDEITFQVSVDNTTIVTYDVVSKTFVSGTKAGTTTAHFVSPKLSVEVTVTVQDDGTAPLFTLDESAISLDLGNTYAVNASLSFRGVDSFSLSSGLSYRRVGEDEENTTISVEGKTITIQANTVGSDTYTIFTEYAGLILSKNLTVTVLDNQAFVVIGERLGFDDDGAVYDVSMYQYDSNRINLRKDLSVSKGSNIVSYSDLSITLDSEDVVSLVGDELVVHKSGLANLTVRYGEESKNIKVNVFKPIIEHKPMSIADERFALNLSLEVSGSTRKYTGSTSVTKTFAIEKGSHVFSGADSVSVGGKIVKNTVDTPITYSGGQVTLTAASFDIGCAGEKEVALVMEANDYLVEYTFDMFFITKELSTKSDCDTYLTMRTASDAIYGYYALASDVDYFNYAPAQDYISGAANSYLGFRGTLDGRKPDGSGNFKIKNLKASIYGICITIGDGGTFKNIDFDNVVLNNAKKTSLLASFVFGGNFSNINVNISDDSDVSSHGPDNDPCASGILSCQKIQDSYFEDFTINAQKHVIKSLVGKTASNNTFSNTVINCIDIYYYCTGTQYDSSTLEPTGGILFSKQNIPGITINRAAK